MLYIRLNNQEADMFRKVDDFTAAYRHSLDEALQMLEVLSDESLSYRVAEGHRSIGEAAWHIVQSIPGMANEVGLGLDAGVLRQPVPQSADAIREAYRLCGEELMARVLADWTDVTLDQEDEMYGETWKRGYTLLALYAHEVHHLGQLTVLMRGAGLAVHGRFGPSKEEWALCGMEQPPGLA
jgi:uncharacterized damage-inducible protein DinB